MPVIINKPKTAATLPKAEQEQAVALAPAELSLEALADRYGSLEDQVNALMMNPIFAQFDEVKKELAKRLAAELEPEDTAELAGDHWVLDIGVAAKNPRVLKDGAIPIIQAALGAEAFAKIAKVGLADLDKYLTPAQLQSVVSEDTGYSNKRKITCSFKG